MPLIAGGGAPPVGFRRGYGEAGEEDGVVVPGNAVATSAAARARRHRRLELAGGAGQRGGRRGEVVLHGREKRPCGRKEMTGCWDPRGRAVSARDGRVRRGLGRLGWAGTRPRWEGERRELGRGGRGGPREGGRGGEGEKEGEEERTLASGREIEREDFGPDLAQSEEGDYF
uniref:Uncharacterized protein n=1 Tax=Oryza sativa subsp. japonica TaxID=39947 RepID=Q69KQ7_ORYSJ|nr:hypothetical protein [Oryza sativa Japonica Group]BAD31876.1 hypothetical protein [Oryza sativa Japonica Group]BAD31880.1 hypothetical protein [Oryza sativa Japonica Group]